MKFILFIIFLLWVLPLIIRTVIRLFSMAGGDTGAPGRKSDPREGNVTVHNSEIADRKVADRMGEYVDFKETSND